MAEFIQNSDTQSSLKESEDCSTSLNEGNAFSASPKKNKSNIRWQIGLETDIGGGKENQDECFVWMQRATAIHERVAVLCVLDGHGKEVGRVAAMAAKSCLFHFLDNNYSELLRADSERDMAAVSSFLVNAHKAAHEQIRRSFQEELEAVGYEVRSSLSFAFPADSSADGAVVREADPLAAYLLKRRPPSSLWSCVHGGSSCTLVAVIGSRVYIGNVGDSSALLCAAHPCLGPGLLTRLVDAADQPGLRDGDRDSKPGGPIPEAPLSTVLVLTAEHSPESPSEFRRLRRLFPRQGDASRPALAMVYDSCNSGGQEKSPCNNVFEQDADGSPVVTNNGSYYKNVRKEWASMVSTPSYARFQDALAFTRSLGDLHLQAYGVTHLPEVSLLDLQPVFETLHRLHQQRQQQLLSGEQPLDEQAFTRAAIESAACSTLCLVLASDGVWDNWLYEDVARFVADPSCLSAVWEHSGGARRVTSSFMQRNALYAKRNFGAQADNATGILMFISTSEDFPDQAM